MVIEKSLLNLLLKHASDVATDFDKLSVAEGVESNVLKDVEILLRLIELLRFKIKN